MVRHRHSVLCLVVVSLLLITGLVYGQRARCPSACRCQSSGDEREVTCDPPTSDAINFRDVDRDVTVLQVTPQSAGRNPLGTLPDAFGNFDRLHRLILRSAGIQRISMGVAQRLGNVNTLDLVGNDITALRDLSFDGLNNVQVLQLANNGITDIADDDLRSLRNLVSVSFSNNRIRRISAGAFANQPYLSHLELNGNSLQDLPSALFDSVIRLEHLDLRNNQFTEIPRGIQRLLSLRVLLFDNNQLTTVPGQLVQIWEDSQDMEDVSFHNNPLSCQGLEDLISFSQSRDGFKKVCDIEATRYLNPGGQAVCPTCDGNKRIDQLTKQSMQLIQGNRPRPPPKQDPGYVVYHVEDPVRAPKDFDPRRDTKRPPISNVESQTAAKLKQYMPGAGVRCDSQRCYYMSAKGVKEWRTAEHFCQMVGLDLLEINDADEQKLVMKFLIDAVKEDSRRSSPSRGWWMGMRYDTNKKAFVFATTGNPIRYTHWGEGQPNDMSGGEDCTELWDTSDWNDVRCVLPKENMFICESSAAVGKGLVAQGTNIQKDNGNQSGGRPNKVSGSASSEGSSYTTFSIVRDN